MRACACMCILCYICMCIILKLLYYTYVDQLTCAASTDIGAASGAEGSGGSDVRVGTLAAALNKSFTLSLSPVTTCLVMEYRRFCRGVKGGREREKRARARARATARARAREQERERERARARARRARAREKERENER